MKFRILAALCAFAAVGPALAQTVQNAPEIPFDSDANYLKMPKDMYLGEVAGVALDSKKNIYIFHRGNTNGPAYGAAAAQLLEFDPNGNFIREIGKNLYAWSYAHAVRIDPQDNIWVADKGSDMVIRFNQEGQVTLVEGRKPEASDENAHPLEHPSPPLPGANGTFRQVTDMTWDPQGNTYISDGYINSRVVKLNKDGDWVKTWGSYGKEPGQFNTLHSIDSDAKGNVYVADRGNRRIQVFDGDGKLLRIMTIDLPIPTDAQVMLGVKASAETVNQIQAPGAPWAICITPGPGTQYLYAADSYPGRIYKMTLDGKILGWLGAAGHAVKKFGWIHEIACPSENELYVGELLTWRMQKLTLHPK